MGVPRGAQPPSHTAYFVALAGVLLLLLMLLAYCLCFCLKRIKELATQPMPEPVKSVRPPPPAAAYPVQPEVRESATAMARLCKQLPQAHTDTVFPTLSPNKPTMLATPTSPRSPARNSPARARSPAYAISPTRTPACAISPTRTPACAISPTRTPAHASGPIRPPGYATSPGAYAISATGRVLARSPGSKTMALQSPKVISQSTAKKRPSSMPDPPTPAISVSEAQ